MSVPNSRPLERRPIHPGEILREDFLPEYDLSVTALAEAAGVSRQSMNELLRERRAVSPEMALRKHCIVRAVAAPHNDACCRWAEW